MRFIILLALVCVGCASPKTNVDVNVPQKPVFTQPVLDVPCSRISKLAKSVALIRDAGISQDDAPLLLNTDLPMMPVIREVYSRPEISPAQGANNSYTVCTKVGFETMLQALQRAQTEYEENETRVLQEEYRILKRKGLKMDKSFK